jgi:PTH1 family peptidyl-tRNA hydrolase
MATDSEDSPRERFVVGLGNPGRRYANTRHNVGFMVLERLRARWQFGEGRAAFGGKLNRGAIRRGAAERRVALFEPHTFMNLSGGAVGELVTFFKASPSDVLVVMDDIALPTGRLRLRCEGTSGGHKGLGDIVRALGTLNVARLRVGVGAPPPVMDAADYVLAAIGPQDAAVLTPAMDRAAEAVEDWVFGKVTDVMEKFNRKEDKPGPD